MTTRKTAKIILFIICTFLVQQISMEDSVSMIENDGYNKTLSILYMEEKVDEIKKNEEKQKSEEIHFKKEMNVESKMTYTGDLTGYGADCKLCSGKLGCNGQNVKDGTTTYNDKEYGEVRIVASSKKIKCGSIVKFKYKNQDTYAIVLDRGVLGYDLDLLVKSEKYASKNVGRQKITYNVLRNGWK